VEERKIYGTTELGGLFNKGVLFEYDWLKDSLIKKFDFDSINGSYPYGAPKEALNGKLYGVTGGGGIYNNYGVLYEFDPVTNVFTKKLDFDSINNGCYGGLTLALDNNGMIYGMLARGGQYTWGTLFEYNPYTNLFSKKHDFQGPEGALPWSNDLTWASNGNFYAMTNGGGSYSWGALFEYNVNTSSLTNKHSFSGFGSGGTGQSPNCSLVLSTNGKLYGLVDAGGLNSYGLIYEYDYINNIFTKKFELFSGWTTTNGNLYGCAPIGSMVEGPNGKLYGWTNVGGNGPGGLQGTIFEFNPSNGNFTKKFDFNGSNGSDPGFGHMIVLDSSLNSIHKSNNVKTSIFPNPTSDNIFIRSTSELGAITVTNNIGDILYRIRSKSREQKLDISTLPPGVYFISTGDKHLKFIKE